MFEFGSLLMQVVTTPSTTDTIVGLITSIGSIVVAIGAIAHSLSLRPELKHHKEAIQAASDFLSDVGNHVVQSKADIKTLAEVTYEMSPEKAKEIVNKQNIRLSELQAKLDAANAQIKRVPPALDHI
jgi:hypothetical protein